MKTKKKDKLLEAFKKQSNNLNKSLVLGGDPEITKKFVQTQHPVEGPDSAYEPDQA